MKAPWTVNLANLADHAVPVGEAINRWLWRWSPWHLVHLREVARRELWASRQREAEAADRLRQLEAFVQAYHQPSRLFPLDVRPEASLEVGPAVRGLRVQLRAMTLNLMLAAEPIHRKVDAWPYVKDLIVADLSRQWSEAARTVLDEVLGQLKEDPRVHLAAPR